MKLFAAAHCILAERRRSVALTAEDVDAVVSEIADLAMTYYDPVERRKLLEELCTQLGIPWYVNAYVCESARGTHIAQSMTPIGSIAVERKYQERKAIEQLVNKHASLGKSLSVVAEFRRAPLPVAPTRIQ